jgi:hypothetical protein
MKIYKRLVVDMTKEQVIYEDSFNYEGDIALAGGGQKVAKPEPSESAKIVKDLYGGPLKPALYSVLSPTTDDAYSQMAGQRLVQGIRGGYGARGLAGSGIAQKGEAEGLANLMTDLAMKKEDKAVQILGAGGSATGTTPIPGRGFMGLK